MLHNPCSMQLDATGMTMQHPKANTPAEEILKCPRCDSMNTKFCYYNNYSLTQPRHFCKNCRRYWTKGGALRNVPIGGGCRKNRRIKPRSLDANSLASLEANNMVANVSSRNCSTHKSPVFSYSSTSTCVDLSKESQRFRGLALPSIEETLRLQDQSGAVSSNDSSFHGICAERNDGIFGLLKGSYCQPCPTSSLSSPNTNLMGVSYPSCSVKHKGDLSYTASDVSCLSIENSGQVLGTALNFASLEDQLSTEDVSMQLCNVSGIGGQLKILHENLSTQLLNEANNGEQEHLAATFEGRIEENSNYGNRRCVQPVDDGFQLSDWHGASLDPPLEIGRDSSFWNNMGWTQYFHALAGSTVRATL